MLKTIQSFFQRQPLGLRIAVAVAVPLITYMWFYDLALDQVGSLTGESAFKQPDTGFVWMTYIIFICALQYCIWQPPTPKP